MYIGNSGRWRKKIEKSHRNVFLVSFSCVFWIGKVEEDDIFISFDGWKGAFDYSCKYFSRDIFPVGWCEKSGHPLQPPGHKSKAC